MNNANYKQYDTRWAKLGYPKKPHYIKDCGCGEVAICNCIIEMARYANETPATIQPYCKQYAAPNGDGTYFAGIPAMMKHYGMTEVKEHATMEPLWNELAKGGRVAIYLMGSRKGGSKRVHWTGSAHFVCSVDYKYENGKHYLYVKDSNSDSPLRNGWISYEENMKGDVSKVWSGKLNGDPAPAPTPDGHYTGPYPNPRKYLEKGDKGTEVGKLQAYINWFFHDQYGRDVLKVDNDYGQNTLNYCKLMQAALGFAPSECNGEVGQSTIARMKAYVKPTATAKPEPVPAPATPEKKAYSGQLPTFPASVRVTNASILAETANQFAYADNSSKATYPKGKPKAAYKAGLNRAYPNRKNWSAAPKAGASCDVFVGTCVRCAGIDPNYPRGLSPTYTGKCGHFDKVGKGDVQDGDVIFLAHHVCIAYGGKTKEASNGDFYPKTTNTLKKRISSAKVIYRAKGTTTISRNYLKKGDQGEAVTMLQNYLNWFFDGAFFKECGLADGVFGANTEKWTKKMQAALFSEAEADGLVGAKTAQAMAAYKK